MKVQLERLEGWLMSNIRYFLIWKAIFQAEYIYLFVCRIIFPGFKIERKKTYFDITFGGLLICVKKHIYT